LAPSVFSEALLQSYHYCDAEAYRQKEWSKYHGVTANKEYLLFKGRIYFQVGHVITEKRRVVVMPCLEDRVEACDDGENPGYGTEDGEGGDCKDAGSLKGIVDCYTSIYTEYTDQEQGSDVHCRGGPTCRHDN
jgi:hypothetical protein